MPGSNKTGTTGLQDPPPIRAKRTEALDARIEATEGQTKPKPKAPKPLLSHYEAFLIPLLILFMLGNALAFALPALPFAQPMIGLTLMALLVGLMVYTVGQGAKGYWKIRLALWAMALLAGSVYYQQFHFVPDTHDVKTLAPLERAEVMGTVETMLNPHQAIIQVKTVNNQPVTGRLVANIAGDSKADDPADDIQAGTRLLITGDLRLPFHSPIPGVFDQEKYLLGQQVTALLKRPERLVMFEVSNDSHYVLQRMTDRLKAHIATTFARYLPSPQAEVLGGIVLGDKAIPVDRDTRQSFIQTGLVHILAASGMNVGIIAGAVLWLLSRLKWHYRAKLIAAMAAVAFYSVLTGLPPSIQRATSMLELALFLKLLDRTLSPALLLCLAGSFLLVLHPDHIGSIGFQFSMLTTFGLVTMVSPLQEKLGYYITRWVAGLILVPVIAQLWVWPLSVFYFNQFPIHAVPLNLLAIILVTPLTLIGFSVAAISLIIPPLGGWLSWLSMPFLNALLMLVQWGDHLTWAKWTLPSPSPTLLILLYAQLFVILGLMLGLKKTPLARKLVIALVPLVFMLGTMCIQKSIEQKETQVALLPLSFRHEGYLIQPAGMARYIAILPSGLSYFESRAVADYLKHRNISSLEALILLPESQADDAQEQTLFKSLKRVHLNAILTTSELAALIPKPSQKRVKLFPASGAQVQLGSVRIHAQFPALQIMANQRCLIEVTNRYQADSPCGIQAVQEASDLTRLFSAKPLDSNEYYELHQQYERMDITHETAL